jgi:signal transduction histidine kinase
VLEAIAVVLVRLASACQACHQHARARRLLVDKEMAESALQALNGRMAEILSLSADGFANFDADGRLAFFNPQASALLGLALADGQTLAQIDAQLHTLPAEPVAMARAIEGAGPQGTARGVIRLAAPHSRTLAYTLQRAAEGARTVLHLRDITRETEVDRLKSEFLATAAHELRTPMVSVFGFTELLLTRGDSIDRDRQRRMLETMHRQSSLLIDLIGQLLDLARIEARSGLTLDRRPERLGPLVQHAVDCLMLPTGREPVQVQLHDGAAQLEVDAGRFHRAVLNVLGNACKYSPAGGPITLDTEAAQLDGRPAVVVRITDRGIGMTPDQLARIFERFYRADDSGHIPGSGLGMSLVKEILDLHGGRVEVTSRPGGGTEVTLWWPLAAPVAADGDAPQGVHACLP